MSIILIIILVTSASGIILYREHKIDTTGNIEFYIDSDEMMELFDLEEVRKKKSI